MPNFVEHQYFGFQQLDWELDQDADFKKLVSFITGILIRWWFQTLVSWNAKPTNLPPFFTTMLYQFTTITLIISPILIKPFFRIRMNLELNVRKWWKCSGNELWAMNLTGPNFIGQDDECHHHSGNQALMILTWNMDQ